MTSNEVISLNLRFGETLNPPSLGSNHPKTDPEVEKPSTEIKENEIKNKTPAETDGIAGLSVRSWTKVTTWEIENSKRLSFPTSQNIQIH